MIFLALSIFLVIESTINLIAKSKVPLFKLSQDSYSACFNVIFAAII